MAHRLGRFLNKIVSPNQFTFVLDNNTTTTKPQCQILGSIVLNNNNNNNNNNNIVIGKGRELIKAL